MDRQYWDNVADNYEKEIFISLKSDISGNIKKTIEKYGSKKAEACDFGCGIGVYLPLLGGLFKNVHAFDLSERLIERARKNTTGYKNINCTACDLADPKVKLPKADFAVMMNVLIVASYYIRSSILKNVRKSLKKGAKIVILTPSLESAIYSNYRFFEWNLKDGMKPADALKRSMKYQHISEKFSVSDGIINLNGVPTKHYLKEEFIVFMANHGFKVNEIKKAEYGWDTEFENPPSWIKGPYPWDWLSVCERA
ncbi:MAG: class I SAM-dependent methyltransferase [Candidatus Goldbacteria bacterium]|nr:class I SAM-dependent methyltransferase [Candidatus Goldiibacteriota bacterium]